MSIKDMNLKEREIQIVLSRKQKKQDASCRTTFNLTEKSKEALDYLSENKTKKQVFLEIASFMNSMDKIRSIIVKEAVDITLTDTNRKAYAVETTTRTIFKKLAKENNVSRDKLINAAIYWYHKFYKEAFKLKKQKVRDALGLLKDLFTEVGNCEEKLENLLGNDDEIVTRAGIITTISGNLISAIDTFLKTGEPIDPDDFSQS